MDRELIQRDAAYKMLQVAQSFSPTGKVQAAFAEIYNNARRDSGDNWPDVIQAVINGLMDGLRWDNWPGEV